MVQNNFERGTEVVVTISSLAPQLVSEIRNSEQFNYFHDNLSYWLIINLCDPRVIIYLNQGNR